ncbi:Prx protein [Balamuthia mandrillaris]
MKTLLSVLAVLALVVAASAGGYQKAPDVTYEKHAMDIKMPNLYFEDIKMGDIKVPDLYPGDIKVPDVKFRDVKVPDIKLPNVKVPDIKVPGTFLLFLVHLSLFF